MQSIITKYRGATDTKGARMTATSSSGVRRSYPYSYDMSADENHEIAAHNFANDLGWKGRWVNGAYNDKGAEVWVNLKAGSGYVFEVRT